MNKTYKIAIGLFILLLVSLVWLESSESEPLNWTPSYAANDRVPLGTYVFYESLKSDFRGKIEEIKIPPYEYLNDTPGNGTYFFLNDRVIFDKEEIKDLLNWVSAGNTAFISAINFGDQLTDTLKLSLSTHIDSKDFTSKPSLDLVNPALKLKQAAAIDRDIVARYFDKIDTSRHVVLGTSVFENEKDEKVNFIKAEFGEGNIYLHTVPQAFSNYFILKRDNYRYAEALMAYFSEQNILWDAYYKSGKSFFTSPLYILLNNRELKWAYYFVLLASILFILFEGKRKQRPIPVKKSPPNRSLEFTETVSQLYIERKKFHELGLKKIMLFFEHIRNNYRLDPSEPNESFYRNLAGKTQNSLDETRALFQRISKFQEKKESTKDEFFELSKSINTFKRTNGKPGNQPE